jgi:hypothetical protein
MLPQVARTSLVFILLVYRGKWCQALDGVDGVIGGVIIKCQHQHQ